MKEKYEQFVTKITQYFKRSTLSDNTVKVTRDWNYILGLMMLTIIVFCGMGVYVFFFAEHYADDEGRDSVFVSTTFDKEEFEQILLTHEERNNAFMELRDKKPLAPDLGIVKKVIVVPIEESEEGGEDM